MLIIVLIYAKPSRGNNYAVGSLLERQGVERRALIVNPRLSKQILWGSLNGFVSSNMVEECKRSTSPNRSLFLSEAQRPALRHLSTLQPGDLPRRSQPSTRINRNIMLPEAQQACRLMGTSPRVA